MWKVTISPRAEKALNKLPLTLQKRIDTAINKLQEDPFYNSVKIQTMSDTWRIRVGDYRILFQANKAIRTIFISDIDHRSNIY